MRSNYRFSLIVWLFAIVAILWVVGKSQNLKPETAKLSFSEFIKEVKEDKVAEITFRGNNKIVGEYKEGYKSVEGKAGRFETNGNTRSEYYIKVIEEAGITPNYEEEDSFWKTALLGWLPVLAVVFIFFLFMRQLQSGSNKAMSFGQSRAKLFNENQTKLRFKDVSGCDEAKDDLVEIVDFLKHPKKFTRLGGKIPKGVLLIGPPGTGKTLLAKAVAGEASVPFFSISGSDFVEMFVGVGASRVRSLFENAKKAAPCLVFIDEIDAVGRHRGAGLGGGHDEREQTLNQLLVEMDGFEGTEGIIVIAATNRADVLDPALLRPGRFDRRIMVPKPDLNGRIGILNVHVAKVPLSKAVDIEVVARGTPGFSGADLANLVNEAALNAARRDSETVDPEDFEEAKDKVAMGSARKSMVVSDQEKRHTAYHEAGHALVARLIEGNDPVHKVTIIPRGPAMGVTMTLPKEDTYSLTRARAEAMIVYMMGGRSAEELVFNHFTTGASNDIERATDLARKMVTEWGMSERLGPLNYASGSDNPFLGREISSGAHFSEETNQLIDQEIREIVERNYNRAKKVLTENVEKLHAMSEALLKYETIDGADVELVMQGKEIVKQIVAAKNSSSVEEKKDSKTSDAEEVKSGVVDLSKPVKA
ncbi:ATP-dependent metallopeptidase FtsH/Yme1/Tma family protein [bacterium]|nr:ATP-dependent metallopeptidase FtsH/Yme1/Tma family protein [bacterium]